jgi:hypothetical protein
MQILVHDPTTPSVPPAGINTTTGGRRKKNEIIAPPWAQPLCALCKREGHPTNRCPTLPELHNLIQLPRATPLLTTPPSNSVATTKSSTARKKGLQTNFSCAICLEYGHYTHHCPTLTQFCQTLAAVCQTSQPGPPQALPTTAHIIDIHYVSSSVSMRIRYPPQYRDIQFMSSETSHPVHNIPSTSPSLEDNNTHPLTVPPVTSSDPLYSHTFHCDEDILEELTTIDCPWNALHH